MNLEFLTVYFQTNDNKLSCITPVVGQTLSAERQRIIHGATKNLKKGTCLCIVLKWIKFDCIFMSNKAITFLSLTLYS